MMSTPLEDSLSSINLLPSGWYDGLWDMGHHPLNKEGDQEDGEEDGVGHFFGGLTKFPSWTNPFEKHNKSKCSPGNGNGDHVRRISLCDKKDREDETEEKKW